MESYSFLMYLAVILISTKVLGLFSRKINAPAVFGAIIAGIILGPSVLNLISFDSQDGIFIETVAEVGVILLMFSAGLETDLNEIRKDGKASFVAALIGVIGPLIGGTLCYLQFFHTTGGKDEMLKALFIGVSLTATSVSITVETLREMGKLNGRVGNTILGAAVMDDIIGIIVLTIVSGMKDTSISIVTVLVKIVLYLVLICISLFITSKLRPFIERGDEKRRIVILAVAICFILAFVSERYFGIADITGAYFAGLMFCTMKVRTYISRRVEIASYLIFSPVFFASIGLKTSITGFDLHMLLFCMALLVIAVITKVIGCGLGTKLCGYSGKEALQVGVGMISRGEVALIVAQKGYQYGLVDDTLFAPIVLVVIITTLITPVLLKIAMKNNDENAEKTKI